MPKELREGLPDDALVSVTVEPESPRRGATTAEELQREIEEARKSFKNPITMEEAVRQIRELRDEWDD
ncbi:hypothetical protein [Brucella sp. IR073]|uniref:hypothetical protein n=1 Tax=unclassified Brucella TaxID=2632610 RepID=UPI003B97F633